MENNKLAKMAEKSMQIKSLKDLVRVRSNENPVLLLDCSGSMDAFMRNGKRRIGGLREVVRDLQVKKVTPMIAFGPRFDNALEPTQSAYPDCGFVTDVPNPAGDTWVNRAIDMAAEHGFGRIVLISDGGPNDRHLAMESARRFGGRIDVMYVGDPGDGGSFFLDELAQLTGGTRFEGDLSEPKELTGAIVGLLAGDVLEQDEDDEDEDDDEEDEEDEEDED